MYTHFFSVLMPENVQLSCFSCVRKYISLISWLLLFLSENLNSIMVGGFRHPHFRWLSCFIIIQLILSQHSSWLTVHKLKWWVLFIDLKFKWYTFNTYLCTLKWMSDLNFDIFPKMKRLYLHCLMSFIFIFSFPFTLKKYLQADCHAYFSFTFIETETKKQRCCFLSTFICALIIIFTG